MALCRPLHRHSTYNSPPSFRVRTLAPSLCFALSMDLYLGAQIVSTCYSLSLMSVALCRLRHRHSTDNSPHSFRVSILALFLWFALSMVLYLGGPQFVSTCFSLRWLVLRRLLVHVFNIARAWCCAALGNQNSPYNSPHSFRVCILAPALWFALSMGLLLGSQGVSNCFYPSLVDGLSSSSGS